jgi:hypothetical protein
MQLFFNCIDFCLQRSNVHGCCCLCNFLGGWIVKLEYNVLYFLQPILKFAHPVFQFFKMACGLGSSERGFCLIHFIAAFFLRVCLILHLRYPVYQVLHHFLQVVYAVLLCVVDIVLVYDIILKLGDVFIHLVAHLLNCNVFCLLFLSVQNGCFSHLSHSVLKCISSGLNCSNLSLCLILPRNVCSGFYYQVGYMGRLVS